MSRAASSAKPLPDPVPVPAGRAAYAATLAVVLFGYLVLPMSMSGATVAVRRIGTDLDASGASLQWVVTGYFLAASSFMLVTGSLGDLFGRRRVYRLGAVVYGAGSLAAAFAPNILLLDAARTVTGVGAAGVMAGGGAILATTFTGAARTKAFAAMGSMAGVGLAIGPTAAGWLVGSLGWRAMFGLFGSAGLVLFVGAWALTESRAVAKPRLDRAGIALFISGLALAMFAITQGAQAGWGSPRVLVPGVAGLALLGAFVVVERRVAGRGERPLLDLSLIANRRFSGWLLAAMASGVAFGGMLANLPTYLQGANGLSSGDAGLVMLMPTLPILVLPAIGGRLVTKGVPPRALVAFALLLMAAGNVWLTVLHPGIGAAGLAGPLVMIGSGQGLVAGVIDAQAMSAVAPERAGMAAGLLNTVRGSTQALTMALFGSALITLLERSLGSAPLAGHVATGDIPAGPEGAYLADTLTDAWRVILVAVAVLVALAAVTVFRLLRPGSPDAGNEGPGAADHKASGGHEAESSEQPKSRVAVGADRR